MKKQSTFNVEQIKELKEWLLSEIEKVTKDINRYNATGNYSRAERAEGERDAYYKCINALVSPPD